MVYGGILLPSSKNWTKQTQKLGEKKEVRNVGENKWTRKMSENKASLSPTSLCFMCEWNELTTFWYI